MIGNTDRVASNVRPLEIAPTSAEVVSGDSQHFSLAGGVPPYVFSLTGNQSRGYINQNGLYTAGPTGRVTDTVRVTDANNYAADARVTVVARTNYLKYLPGIYSQSEFMGRFLQVFEDILGPIEGVLDNTSYYFDPSFTPEELLPWLAGWVNLVLDDSWPLERRRELVRSAVELFQWRGTAKGLRDYLRIYAGVEPKIIEDYGSMPLDERSRLGWNTVLGETRPYTFTVVLNLASPSSVDVGKVKAIINAEKPAHTGYSLILE